MGDDLLADEVPAGGEVGRENKVVLAPVGNELVDGPLLGRGIVAVLVDLGPDGRGAVALGVLLDVSCVKQCRTNRYIPLRST